MEDAQQQPLRPSFPPTGMAKWLVHASPGGMVDHERSGAGGCFGQDSGYSSYQATTPNNTFNQSSHHGASGTLATIDEADEPDSNFDISSGSSVGSISSTVLTPKTAASIDQISNFHLTTPNSSTRANRNKPRRPLAFSYTSGAGSSESSFVAPSTPERLPLARSISFEANDTPLGSVNRSSQHTQLTPHKAKGVNSGKRKLSSFRGKLYSEGDIVPEKGSDENRANDMNDLLDCKRLEDISPIPKMKRHKPNENITNLIRCSTPKTASSQPRFHVGAGENIPSGVLVPGGQGDQLEKRKFRKFQSFSPSKIQSNRQKYSLRLRQEDRVCPPDNRHLVRQNALVELELTPQKNRDRSMGGSVTPSKEHRVLTEIHPVPQTSDDFLPSGMNLGGLLDAPILEDPLLQPSGTEQLVQAISTIPSLEDFSMTPSKATLVDPEFSLGADSSFATEDFVARHVSNLSYGPTLNSILEESPIQAEVGIVSKRMHPRLHSKSPMCRVKRLANNRSDGSIRSPLRQAVRIPPGSPARGLTRDAEASFKKPGLYCGMEQMNMLERLYERNQDTLPTLLQKITDGDLVNVVRVSRGWRAIIQSFPKIWERLQAFLETQKEDKENNPQIAKDVVCPGPTATRWSFAATNTRPSSPSVALARPAVEDVNSSAVTRRPFQNCNSFNASIGNSSSASSVSLYASFGFETAIMPERLRRSSGASSVIRSPPVSPSKIKFVTNQKVVAGLKPSEQLRPCPRCKRPSRIIFSRSSKNGKNKAARPSAVAARLEKSYTLPDPATNNNVNGTTKYNTRSSELYAGLPGNNENDCINNNNDYHNSKQRQQNIIDSPDRVRKNLFSSSTGSSGAKPLTVPSNRRGSLVERHHREIGRSKERPKLRSGAKSVDSSSPVGVAASGTDSLGVRDSKCDYAICSGPICRFQFCIKCLGEYHPNTVCDELAPNSPSKELQHCLSNVACSSDSRRALQRLCK